MSRLTPFLSLISVFFPVFLFAQTQKADCFLEGVKYPVKGFEFTQAKVLDVNAPEPITERVKVPLVLVRADRAKAMSEVKDVPSSRLYQKSYIMDVLYEPHLREVKYNQGKIYYTIGLYSNAKIFETDAKVGENGSGENVLLYFCLSEIGSSEKKEKTYKEIVFEFDTPKDFTPTYKELCYLTFNGVDDYRFNRYTNFKRPEQYDVVDGDTINRIDEYGWKYGWHDSEKFEIKEVGKKMTSVYSYYTKGRVEPEYSKIIYFEGADGNRKIYEKEFEGEFLTQENWYYEDGKPFLKYSNNIKAFQGFYVFYDSPISSTLELFNPEGQRICECTRRKFLAPFNCEYFKEFMVNDVEEDLPILDQDYYLKNK